MRPVSRKVLALAGAVGLAVNTGCFAYVPLSSGPAPLSVGADVRVTLTAGGSEDLARFLGPRVHAADGKVESINADGDPTIGVTWVELADGNRQPWMGEGVVTFPKADVANVALRTLNRRKSYIAAAVLAVAVVGLTYVAVQGGGGNIRDDPGAVDPFTSRSPAAVRPN